MAILFTKANLPGDIQSLGSMFAAVGTFTFSGSYATGGDAIDLNVLFSKVGLGTVYLVEGAFRGYEVEYDSTNKKLIMYSSANTELAAAAYNAALTASPVPVFIVGR